MELRDKLAHFRELFTLSHYDNIPEIIFFIDIGDDEAILKFVVKQTLHNLIFRHVYFPQGLEGIFSEYRTLSNFIFHKQ